MDCCTQSVGPETKDKPTYIRYDNYVLNCWHVGSIIPTELNDVVKLKYETLDFQEFDLRQVSLSLMALTWVDLSVQRGLMGCLAAT